jgi:hypothetical protein
MKIGTDIRFRIFIHQRGRSLLTEPKAGTRLNGQSSIIGRLTGLDIAVLTKMI